MHFRPKFDFGIEKRCLYPSARVSIDLVTRKAKRDDRTSFGPSNACPILGCEWVVVVERWTVTEISVCLYCDPKASPGAVTRIGDRANEVCVFSGDIRSRM